jgi:cytochrome c-type biogenesis protein CcmH
MTRARRIMRIGVMALCAASALPVFVPLSRAQALEDRAKQVGGKFMCMCGCNQVLTQCNHVGCTVSTSMLKELDDRVAKGDSETAITQAFVQEFGTQVYAEPPKSGISLVAWSLPTIYLAIGTVLVVMVIWRWRARPHLRAAAASVPPGMSADQLEDVRQRVARETED